MAATLSVELDGVTRVLPWPPGTRMLDVLIAAGLEAPYSCRQGICGACACQLTGGEVEMAHNEVLEAADLADGYILACQAVPLTPEVRIYLLNLPGYGTGGPWRWRGPAAPWPGISRAARETRTRSERSKSLSRTGSCFTSSPGTSAFMAAAA